MKCEKVDISCAERLFFPQQIEIPLFLCQKGEKSVENRPLKQQNLYLTIEVYFSIILTCKAKILYRSAVFSDLSGAELTTALIFALFWVNTAVFQHKFRERRVVRIGKEL